MATVSSKVVAYLPSLRTLLHRLRATTSTPSSLTSTLLVSSPLLTSPLPSSATCIPGHSEEKDTVVDFSNYSSALKQPDTIAKLGLQPDMILPGAVGTVPSISTTEMSPNDEEEREVILGENSAVECVVQDCPSFLYAGLMQLFPDISLSPESLRVITISERTNNDMTSWSQDVEQEREELMEHFVHSAKEICSRVIGAGYWADFIDPSSGRPYFGAFTNKTLFETDDRYRYFGFDILDLGCCKCISHRLWGTHAFVGIIFTDAPMLSPVIGHILTL